MRRLFLLLFVIMACEPLNEESPIEEQNIYHGRLTVASGTYEAMLFKAQTGDSILGGARKLTGSNFTFFWATDVEFQEWMSSGDQNGLINYTENVSEVSVAGSIPSNGNYYVVFYAPVGQTNLDVRFKTRRWKE
ncbi:MAG: hypothetical protein ACP5QG_02650 [candidate division WOR-3 bacterium]